MKAERLNIREDVTIDIVQPINMTGCSGCCFATKCSMPKTLLLKDCENGKRPYTIRIIHKDGEIEE